MAFICVNGAWELEPVPCGCDDDGVGGSGGNAGALGGEAGAGSSNPGRGGESGGGNAGDAGAGGASDERKVPAGTCPDETEVSSGLFSCDDGSFYHRAQAALCALPEHDPDDRRDSPEETEWEALCNHDRDCYGGYCVTENIDGGIFHHCVRPCTDDSECATGTVCSCEPHKRATNRDVILLGECRPATCVTDQDCGSGSFCIAPVPLEERASTYRSFSCQEAADKCSGPRDCPENPDKPERVPVCRLDSAGDHLVCALRPAS